MDKPLGRLKYHVTGAIERGEKTAIEAVTNGQTDNIRLLKNAFILLEKIRTNLNASGDIENANLIIQVINEIKSKLSKPIPL